jgi:MFS family permease
LISGPGDAFINNFGTILGTLYPPPSATNDPSYTPLPQTTPATHITIIAVGSTIARLLSGTLSDLLSPSSEPHQNRRGPASLTNSLLSLNDDSYSAPKARFTLSRLPLLLFSTLLLSIGFVVLASGIVQDHASPRFAIVTGLIGVGYGATFSLTPIIISCVWGVENFGYVKKKLCISRGTNDLTARTGASLQWSLH